MEHKSKIPLCESVISLSFIIFVIIDLKVSHVEFLFVRRIQSGSGGTEFNDLLSPAWLLLCVRVCIRVYSMTMTETGAGNFAYSGN